MAMDALRNLTTNIPNWQSRLDILSGEINKRQVELAALAKNDSNAETRSMRNKGSTESLKPKDDGPAHIHIAAGDQVNGMPAKQNPRPSFDAVPEAAENSAEAIKAVQERARVQVKKRVRPSSLISAEANAAAPTYRTRSMIIVYYDSYVQGFFDELVRFTSSSRNLMRKAKMAAKVAQIKKLAEMDVSNGADEGEDNLPSLRYMGTRRFGAMSGMPRPGFGPGKSNEKPDIYDNLDKGLDFVQSTCEHGAHQFLRDADCNDEIKKIQDRLREVLETAQVEIERIEREEPELAKETGELTKARTHRPISVRRQLSACSNKDGTAKDEESPNPDAPISPQSKGSFIEPAVQPLEVDNALEADDEGIAVDFEIPRLQYRSTRDMRRRPQP